MRPTLARVAAREVRVTPVSAGPDALDLMAALRPALHGEGPALLPVPAGSGPRGQGVLEGGGDPLADSTTRVDRCEGGRMPGAAAGLGGPQLGGEQLLLGPAYGFGCEVG